MSSGKKRRSPNWTDNEVTVLLDIWKEYKKQLENSKRNLSLYQEMSNEMAGYYCYRTAEEIRTKIDNMSKRFKYERTQEILKGTKSDWRFYWQIDDIIGLNPSYCVENIKDSISKKIKDRAKGDQSAFFMVKFPNKEEADEIEENGAQTEDMEHNHAQDEPLTTSIQSPLPVFDTIYENDLTNEKFFKDILQDYQQTKDSLIEINKKIIVLLSNQSDLIKTQNELCQTQNAILKKLLEKMV